MSRKGSVCQQLIQDQVPFALNDISECQITQRKITFLKELECPVCFDIIFPPVMQCVHGHLTCVKCLRSLAEPICPICKAAAGASRNLCAEKFLDRHVVRCQNHESNCPEFYWVEQEDELKEHELDCKFRKCQCWIPNCKQKPSLEEMTQHWFSEHDDLRGRNYKGSSTYYIFEVGRGSPEYRTSAFKFEIDGNLFLTIFERNGHTLVFYTYCYSPQSRTALEYESQIRISVKHVKGREEIFAEMEASWTGPIYSPETSPSQIMQAEERFQCILPTIDVQRCKLNCEAELRICKKAKVPEDLILL